MRQGVHHLYDQIIEEEATAGAHAGQAAHEEIRDEDFD